MTSTELLTLLHDLSPWLNYDREEPFFADAAEVLIENRYDDGPIAPYATRLMRADGDEVIAARDHDDPKRQLALEFLRLGTYSSGDSALETDYLDPGVEWVADGRHGHTSAAHQNRIYGRIAPSRSGGHWLQYWFFYFASVKGIPSVRSATGPLGFGLHAGDWEMIQLYVPEGSSTATRATYAAHDYAYRVDPAAEEWRDGIPEVFVAVGSHASYPRPGRWRSLGNPVLGFLTKLDDRCSPEARLRPELTVLDDRPDGWWFWPGRWGRTGPQSPGCQDQWTEPDELHENGKDISDGLREQTLEETGAELPEPVVVSMERTGSRVSISFDVPPELEDAWAAMLTIAIDSPDQELPRHFAYDVTIPGAHTPLGG